jgi:hypothetical protein
VNFGLILIVVGGFLLGGSYSIWRADSDTKGRTAPQVAFALILLIAALLASVSGVLRLI